MKNWDFCWAILVLSSCCLLACAHSRPPSGTGPADAATVVASPSQSTDSHRLCVGGGHTCFVDGKHSLWCWGANYYGQIGVGTHGFGGRMENRDSEHTNVKKPPRIGLLEGKVKAVGCGTQKTCAVTLDGTVYCWGINENPKPPEMLSDVPVRRDIGGKALALELENSHACAIRADRTLWCWGSEYDGSGTASPRTGANYVPAIQIKAFGNDVADVGVSEESICVLEQSDASLWCWGENREGELGDGSNETRLSPVRVAGSKKVTGFATGQKHVCAINEDGRLWCWGRNYEGQLGNGRTPKTKPVNYATPQQVSKQFNGIRALDLGFSETLVVDATGELYAFGDLSSGARGLTPAPDSTPRRVALPAPVLEVGANDGHRCVLLTDESIWCWGNGEEYALGTGTDASAKDPVRVVFPK